MKPAIPSQSAAQGSNRLFQALRPFYSSKPFWLGFCFLLFVHTGMHVSGAAIDRLADRWLEPSQPTLAQQMAVQYADKELAEKPGKIYHQVLDQTRRSLAKGHRVFQLNLAGSDLNMRQTFLLRHWLEGAGLQVKVDTMAGPKPVGFEIWLEHLYGWQAP